MKTCCTIHTCQIRAGLPGLVDAARRTRITSAGLWDYTMFTYAAKRPEAGLSCKVQHCHLDDETSPPLAPSASPAGQRLMLPRGRVLANPRFFCLATGRPWLRSSLPTDFYYLDAGRALCPPSP